MNAFRIFALYVILINLINFYISTKNKTLMSLIYMIYMYCLCIYSICMYELQNKYNKYKVLHLLISYSMCMYELQNKFEVLHLLNS